MVCPALTCNFICWSSLLLLGSGTFAQVFICTLQKIHNSIIHILHTKRVVFLQLTCPFVYHPKSGRNIWSIVLVERGITYCLFYVFDQDHCYGGHSWKPNSTARSHFHFLKCFPFCKPISGMGELSERERKETWESTTPCMCSVGTKRCKAF